MNQTQHDAKIKFVCRIQENQYQQECFLDCQKQEHEEHPAVRGAAAFLEAFSPETVTRQMTAQYGENFVLVFRTTESQMLNFCEIFEKTIDNFSEMQ